MDFFILDFFLQIYRRKTEPNHLSSRRGQSSRHAASPAGDRQTAARRRGLRRDHQPPDQARLHRRQGLRQNLGHYAGRSAGHQQAAGHPRAGLPVAGQLHSLLQTAAGREDVDCGRGGGQAHHLGPQRSAQNQGHALEQRGGLLRTGRVAGRQVVLLLLLGWEYLRVGLGVAEGRPDLSGPFRRGQLY